jgi:hypothetical protein
MTTLLDTIARFFRAAEPMRRQRRKVLTDKMVADLPRKRRRYGKMDPEQRGHYLRIPPKGPVVFYAVSRNPFDGKVRSVAATPFPVAAASEGPTGSRSTRRACTWHPP